MAFYSPDPAMGQLLENVVRALELEGRPGLSQRLSITWLRFAAPLGSDPPPTPQGAAWAGASARQPGRAVQLVYLAAAEAWLQRRLLEDTPELRRALAAMAREGSNDAASLVVDLLSGTGSGPALPPARFAAWAAQRQLVNDWLAAFGWPELDGANACQKTWSDGPHGREHDFMGPRQENRNRLSSDALARLLRATLAGELLSPPATARVRELLERPGGSGDPLLAALGEGLPADGRIWGSAGRLGECRHAAFHLEAEGYDPCLLVVLVEGEASAAEDGLIPFISGRLLQSCRRRNGAV